MADTVEAGLKDVAVLRHMAAVTRQVVQVNTGGVTHEESLVAPERGGNCMNWVLGHIQHVYEMVLGSLGQPAVLGVAAVARYARGSAPLGAGEEAVRFEELVRAFEQASERVAAGLAALTPEALEAPCPPEFGKNMRELYGFVFFHQAYHAGQLGVLRHAAGHAGAVK